MTHLPSTPKTFLELLGLSIRKHFPVFKCTFWLILFFVVVKDAYIYAGGFPQNHYAFITVAIVMGVLVTYLFSAILYASSRILTGEYVDWKNALSNVLPRMPKVLLSLVALLVFASLLFMLASWIDHWWVSGDVRPPKYARLIEIGTAGFFVMVAYIYYFYTIPSIIMDNKPLGPAFLYGPSLVAREWKDIVRVFGVYACGWAAWILVSPDTLHGHLMAMYRLSAIYDLIVLSVVLPILVNFIVLMRNDLVLRKEIRESKS